MDYDTLVIGGGQSGLATGYYLQRAGLRFRILEAGDEPVGAWPGYRDSLVLNSPARYSALPGLAFPGHPDHYPTRDEVVDYLRGYAAHFRLPVLTRTRVQAVEHTGGGFLVTTAEGGHLTASTVVAATGFFGHPAMPTLPGQDRFGGRLLHLADYRRPEPFRGQRVVVVGGGNGGVQVAVELAAVAEVTLATRRPIRRLPQRILGRDIHFWLRWLGLDQTQWLGKRGVPAFINPTYEAALLAGRPDQRSLFRHFAEHGVVWSDGTVEPVDSVIFATGYRPQPTYLDGLGALDAGGQLLQRGGRSTMVEGLYYVGFPKQRTAASTTLRGAGADAQIVVSHLQRYCRTIADSRRLLPLGDAAAGLR
ncbi:MAG: NAD(P)/FAD-dependent oxidoreductase [Chloroflexales bacterium]|nr:NAD(P)/FAD-dependent oxidoreductase [Chloroflexales bacterium]